MCVCVQSTLMSMCLLVCTLCICDCVCLCSYLHVQFMLTCTYTVHWIVFKRLKEDMHVHVHVHCTCSYHFIFFKDCNLIHTCIVKFNYYVYIVHVQLCIYISNVIVVHLHNVRDVHVQCMCILITCTIQIHVHVNVQLYMYVVEHSLFLSHTVTDFCRMTSLFELIKLKLDRNQRSNHQHPLPPRTLNHLP